MMPAHPKAALLAELAEDAQVHIDALLSFTRRDEE